MSLCIWSFFLASHTVPCPVVFITSHPALGLLGLLLYHGGVIIVGVGCINRLFVAEFPFWGFTFFCLSCVLLLCWFLLLKRLIIYILNCNPQIIPTPFCPITCLFCPFILFSTTMSISVRKGHPGNREAVVDREINKQKKRERSDGGQSLVIHRVNYRPHLRSTLWMLHGLQGVRGSLLFYCLCMYIFDLVSRLCHSLLSLTSRLWCAQAYTRATSSCRSLSLWGQKACRQ